MDISVIKQLLHRFFYKPYIGNTIIGQKQRAYGVDVSRYEPDFNPDNATPGLIDFGIIKATEGVSWKDPYFDTLYTQVSKLSVKGTYHYLKSGYSGISQANFFLDTIRGKSFDILAIDFESYGNILNDAFVRILYDCLIKVSGLVPDKKVILYTNPNLYDTIIYPASIRIWGKDIFTKWNLWIAQYPYIPNPDGQPSMPRSRSDWSIWQFSEDGQPAEHGTSSWIDRDVFNGTKSQMLSWVNKSGSTFMPYAGVTQKTGTVNNQKYYLQTINLSGKVAKVRHFDGMLVQVQKAAQLDNAQIVVNGDDYVKGGAFMPTGMSYSNGKLYTPQFEFRYWLNISKNNLISYGYGKPPADVYNLTSFIRPLVVAGQLHPALSEPNLVNTEIHARSVLGLNASGELMILVCEGFVNPLTGAAYAGVTLPQAAQIMLDNGAMFAGEHGGGGDAGLYSEGIMQNESSDRDTGLGWRGVVQVIEIFTGDTMADYYKIIGNDGGNHTVRDSYNIKGSPLYYSGTTNRVYITNTIGAESLAADVYVYPADVPDATIAGGFSARKGDTWRKVYKVGTTLVSGWTAEIHLGVRQGITLTPVTVTPPPPPAVSPVIYTSNDIDLLAKTMTITLKKQDGTSETLSYPIA